MSALAYLKILARLSHEATKDSIKASGRITATCPNFGVFYEHSRRITSGKGKKKFIKSVYLKQNRSSTVVKVLYYKSEGRWFDSRWCHWNFSLT